MDPLAQVAVVLGTVIVFLAAIAGLVLIALHADGTEVPAVVAALAALLAASISIIGQIINNLTHKPPSA
jgi:Kef-type K+ transport system membrane component KefB